jgi:tetratricopeptide (TPR) repeat protein
MERPQPVAIFAARLGSLALLLALPCRAAEPAPANPAPSSGVALSESYAARAFEAYGRKEYPLAIELYQKALDAVPSADIVYNIARVYDVGLHDRAQAIRYYRRYVDDPGAVPSRIESASKRLKELRAGELAATPLPDPAARASETAPATTSPAAAPPAQAPSPASSPAVSSGAPASGAPASGVPSAPLAAVTPADDPSIALTVGAIVAGTVGLAGIGVGIGFGLAAKNHLEESERFCNGNLCISQRGVDAAKSAAHAADIATVGLSVGGGLLALGTVLWFMDAGSGEHPALAGHLDWAPQIGPGEIALSLAGRFGGP